MITRLKIKGFKNIIDSEFHFGPFNCIAGLNGVGKSNLFDAIQFLSALADKPFVEAAKSVRGGDDVLQLRCGNEPGPIKFDLDLIIPQQGTDEFNQLAIAGSTYLNYVIEFEIRSSTEAGYTRTKLELVKEELSGYALSHATKALLFKPSREWVRSVVKAGTRVRSFIRTKEDRVELQADRMKVDDKKWRGGGKPALFNTPGLPRSVLSSAQNADENRTAVLVRKEMRSWRQLQLEPSSLGGADDFDAPRHMDRSGAHIPATLYRLSIEGDSDRVFTTLSNRLATLVEGVKHTWVDRDDGRKIFRFMLEDIEGLQLPASSLSDGTLRFVALSTIEQDTSESGLICFEEPENGIHPQRIDAMVDLLYEIASDTEEGLDHRSPLRQVIITTHSPLVAGKVKKEDLMFIENKYAIVQSKRVSGVSVLSIPGTWRASIHPAASQATIKRYLSGSPLIPVEKRTQPSLLEEGYGYQVSMDLD